MLDVISPGRIYSQNRMSLSRYSKRKSDCNCEIEMKMDYEMQYEESQLVALMDSS